MNAKFKIFMVMRITVQSSYKIFCLQTFKFKSNSIVRISHTFSVYFQSSCDNVVIIFSKKDKPKNLPRLIAPVIFQMVSGKGFSLF